MSSTVPVCEPLPDVAELALVELFPHHFLDCQPIELQAPALIYIQFQ
jgi:hypothetical protein